MNYLPERDLLVLLLKKENWLQFSNYIDYNYLKDTYKELHYVYLVLKRLHEQYPEKDFSLADLQAAFFVRYPDSDVEIYLGLFKTLQETVLDNKVGVGILKDIKQRKEALKASELAFKFSTGHEKLENVLQSFKVLEEDIQENIEEFEFVSDDLELLIKEAVQKPGLRWRLDCLNKSLGSLRKGDFGFIFARPETGKTTFLASEVSEMLKQSLTGPVVWFNNEEQGIKVMLRMYQAYFGCTLEQLYANTKKYKDQFNAEAKGQFKLVDSANIDKLQVERTIKQIKPALIIFDQIDKIKGFAADREDLRLGSIYIWARELAKEYAAVIGVCQADGSAEGQKWLTMDNVANAKCLSPETAVLMYDGTWKAISDITVGERVMGPDSTPRNVLSTTTGQEEMFRVTHRIGGDWYEVNKSHLLSLKDQYGNIRIRNVLDYKKTDFGFRVGHELPEQEFTIDPYYLGLWLGDGKASAPEITTMDQEIKDYVREYAKVLGCEYVEWQNGTDNPKLVQAKIKYKQGVKHLLMEKLRKLGLENNKYIPDIYFQGSISQRLQLIAGLLDTDGTLVKRKHEYFLFSNKSYGIAYGLKCLALSCGLMATFKEKGGYYYVHISGNDLSVVPTRISRKQSKWKGYKDVLKSRLIIQPLGRGNYAGFTLDGDHQFIIRGNIVTHNTSKQAEADWILGIGCTHVDGQEYVRYLNISKNKLIGDEDTIPDLRHARLEVLIQPELARYRDIIKYG